MKADRGSSTPQRTHCLAVGSGDGFGKGIAAPNTETNNDAKPFSFVELRARLRACARRASVERPTVLESGDLRLAPATRQVWRGETEVAIWEGVRPP